VRVEQLWSNARLATLRGDLAGLGVIEDGLIAATDGGIVYAGARADAPMLYPETTHDCEGRWITPGLIDCHTHLVHAGNRAREFERRLEGASYEEIARAGGGIVSTMRATRAASRDELVAESLPRLDAMLARASPRSRSSLATACRRPTKSRRSQPPARSAKRARSASPPLSSARTRCPPNMPATPMAMSMRSAAR